MKLLVKQRSESFRASVSVGPVPDAILGGETVRASGCLPQSLSPNADDDAKVVHFHDKVGSSRSLSKRSLRKFHFVVVTFLPSAEVCTP